MIERSDLDLVLQVVAQGSLAGATTCSTRSRSLRSIMLQCFP